MKSEEELERLRQENKAPHETLRLKDEELQLSSTSNQDLREGFKQAITAIEALQERVRDLEGQIACLVCKSGSKCSRPPSVFLTTRYNVRYAI